MGLYTPEFIDAGTRLVRKPRQDAWLRDDEIRAGIANAAALLTIFETRRTSPKIVYFPEGRYYLALPPVSSPLIRVRGLDAMGRPEPTSFPVLAIRGVEYLYIHGEQMADLVVPGDVTLRFGPGATLVPLSLSEAEIGTARTEDWYAFRRAHLPESERFRVRVEVQGAIDAPITKIFDPFMDEDFDPTVMPARPAGLVYFQRETVREVYPEWWGAIPMRGDDVELSAAEVRRTTAALQASIDAAFHHRVQMPSASFNPHPATRPSLPVVLTNNYLIDRPLRVGMTLLQARQRGSHTEAYPPNESGFVMRGECGPASRSGATMIKASQGFQPEAVPDGGPMFGDSRSLMTLRLAAGFSIENVVFDAADRALRCATVMTFHSAHHHCFEGCEFRNAVHTLLHLGGEFPEAVLAGNFPPDTIDASLRYFSGGQDLGDLRVSRCHFSTGGGEGLQLPRAPFRKPHVQAGRWKHAVVFRTEQGLGTEFHGCVFEGPASPMILALGGRTSLQNCSFRAELLDGAAPVSTDVVRDQAAYRWWNGTDIHIGAPFPEVHDGSMQYVFATTLTARNVESRSPQFLSTYPSEARYVPVGRPVFASVTLIQVRHQSKLDDVRPAIYWAGPRGDNCPLVLQSCLFGPRPTSPTDANRFKGAIFVAPRDAPGSGYDTRPVLLIGTRRIGGGALIGSTTDTIPAMMLVSAG